MLKIEIWLYKNVQIVNFDYWKRPIVSFVCVCVANNYNRCFYECTGTRQNRKKAQMKLIHLKNIGIEKRCVVHFIAPKSINKLYAIKFNVHYVRAALGERSVKISKYCVAIVI